MMGEKRHGVPVTAVKPGYVSTIAVRESTLMSETRAWNIVRLGHRLCLCISQSCLLRRFRSFAGISSRWSALD